MGAGWQQLSQENNGQILNRVDPKGGRRRSTPTEFTFLTQDLGFRSVYDYRKSESETYAIICRLRK